MIEVRVELHPRPRYHSVWLTFANVEDFERVVERCRAADWRLGGVLEQGGRTHPADELDTFGAGGCLAWLPEGASVELVAGPALLRIGP